LLAEFDPEVSSIGHLVGSLAPGSFGCVAPPRHLRLIYGDLRTVGKGGIRFVSCKMMSLLHFSCHGIQCSMDPVEAPTYASSSTPSHRQRCIHSTAHAAPRSSSAFRAQPASPRATGSGCFRPDDPSARRCRAKSPWIVDSGGPVHRVAARACQSETTAVADAASYAICWGKQRVSLVRNHAPCTPRRRRPTRCGERFNGGDGAAAGREHLRLVAGSAHGGQKMVGLMDASSGPDEAVSDDDADSRRTDGVGRAGQGA
jgi:hypothetical protein